MKKKEQETDSHSRVRRILGKGKDSSESTPSDPKGGNWRGLILPLALIVWAILFMLFFVGCGGSESSRSSSGSKSSQVEALQEDTVATESLEAQIDSLLRDSLLQVVIDNQYEEGVKMVPGKIARDWASDGVHSRIDWPLEVYNHTFVPLLADDYEISYTTYNQTLNPDDETGNGFREWSETKTLAGIDIAPNDTVKLLIHHNADIVDAYKPRLEMKITPEEFGIRFRQYQDSIPGLDSILLQMLPPSRR